MLVLEGLILCCISDFVIWLVYRVASCASLSVGSHLSFLESVDLNETSFLSLASFIFLSIYLLIVKGDSHEIIVRRKFYVENSRLDALVLDVANFGDLRLLDFWL